MFILILIFILSLSNREDKHHYFIFNFSIFCNLLVLYVYDNFNLAQIFFQMSKNKMNKLIYISSIALTFAFPSIAFANESIDSQDFKYLVCSYIEDSNSLDEALTKIDAVAYEFTLDVSQEEILDNLYYGYLSSENYCMGLEF